LARCDSNQWQPNLFRNTTAIYPFEGNPGWNLTTAMADDAIQYMKQLKEIAPDKPFFIYYVPGGTHAPHHPTPEWVKKISDMHLFDDGWNKLRETIFANQKRLGIMPANAQLTRHSAAVPPCYRHCANHPRSHRHPGDCSPGTQCGWHGGTDQPARQDADLRQPGFQERRADQPEFAVDDRLAGS
jgi:arylsulfatase A-like enzyme